MENRIPFTPNNIRRTSWGWLFDVSYQAIGQVVSVTAPAADGDLYRFSFKKEGNNILYQLIRELRPHIQDIVNFVPANDNNYISQDPKLLKDPASESITEGKYILTQWNDVSQLS